MKSDLDITVPQWLLDYRYLLRVHGLDDAHGRALRRMVETGAVNDHARRALRQRAERFKMEEWWGRLPPFRKPPSRSGDLQLWNYDRTPLVIRSACLTKNVICPGLPGVGKSTLAKVMIPQLVNVGRRVWGIDSVKNDLRHLRPIIRRLRKKLAVMRQACWKFNPLQAGRHNVLEFLELATDALVQAARLPDRGRSIVYRELYRLYKETGNLDGNTSAWPVLHQLVDNIRTSPHIASISRDALVDRLSPIVSSLGGAYTLGYDPVDLGNENMVFELGSASQNTKHLFLAIHIHGLMHHVYATGANNRELSLVVIVDDCLRLLGQHAPEGDVPSLDELVSVNRGAGIGLWFNPQTLNGVSPRLIGCMGNWFVGQLGTHEDRRRIAADINISASELEWHEQHPEPGLFIARIADPDIPYPFLCRVPRLELPQTVTDEEADASLQALAHLKTRRDERFDKWEPLPSVEIRASDKAPVAEAPNSRPPALTEPERRYLQAVVDNVGRPCSEYATLLRLSGRRAAAIRQRLIQAGFLRERELANNARGRPAIVLEPLPKAFEALGQAHGGMQP